jgi:DNA-directed RNA polymerase subunit beta'
MAGMMGLIQNTAGETIEFPILSSMKEGLTPIEYFITTHGSRKGLTDTALNTAKAGYLTRRLFDVAQDAIVSETDCGTKDFIIVRRDSSSGIEIPISKNIRGRVIAEDVKKPDGTVLFKKGHLLSKEDGKVVEEAGVMEVHVRSPLSCKSVQGVCAACYGIDLGKNLLVGLGEAVGTVAAQAIGEPGTQLTMRTFHSGGTASVGGDITQGLPRVEEVFEKRMPKNPAVICREDGVVTEIRDNGKEKTLVVLPDVPSKKTSKKKSESNEYAVHAKRMVLVKIGDKVKKGDFLTDGSADLDDLFLYASKERAQNYIIGEVARLYELQGETVSRKHIEVIVRQMFSRRKVEDPGDTTLSRGDVVDEMELVTQNEIAKKAGGKEAKVQQIILGITEVSLSRKSFLSAASFQHTTRVLINASVRGITDHLVGLKENVIIGRLIPAGTGFKNSAKEEMIRKMRGE